MKTFPLVYITVPEELQKRLFGNQGCPFNPAVPLPVELPPEIETSDGGLLNLTGDFSKKIKIEMILSGLLQELAGNPAGGSREYYRDLVFSLKPAIADELAEAAIIKAKNGDCKSALEILDLLFGLKGETPELLLNRAIIMEGHATAQEAEDAYEAALVNPAEDAFFYAALFYEGQGNYNKAALCLESFLDNGAEEDETEDDAKYGKARELLAEIRNNGLDDAMFMDAVALIRNRDVEKGINKVREFLARRPGAGRAWFVLGWGLRCLSRWKDAAACFEKALELGCVNADCYNELAICRLETGDLAAASVELGKALLQDGENVKVICNLGVLAMKQGDKKTAEAFFRTALEIDPDDPVAREYFGLKD